MTAVQDVADEMHRLAVAAVQLQPLIPDCYALDDAATLANFQKLIDAGDPYAGIILQATNGLGQVGDPAWFPSMWKLARTGPGARYGKTWFRGCYGYHVVGLDPKKQAEYLLSVVAAAGGFGDGDLITAIDIERGEQPAGVTAAQVEDSVSKYNERILELTGKSTMLYAGSFTRDLGITSRMGSSLFWFPEWDDQISWKVVNSMGWDINSTLLWQACGDGSNTAPPGYPHITPMGALDLSIMVRANLPYAQGLEWTRTHLCAQPI